MNKTYVFAALLLVGCHSVKEQNNDVNVSTSNDHNGTTAVITDPAPNERPVYHATETVLTDLILTKLEVSFDWNRSQLIGKETLTAKPHFYASNQLTLDAKGMEIKSVTQNGKPLVFRYENDAHGKLYGRDRLYRKAGRTHNRRKPGHHQR
jgi:aminopeptidase N